MKNISLSIPNPCSENWDNFTPQAQGRLCGLCEKVVIDFSKMSDHQILDFLKNKPTSTCGRFREGQLKSYSFTDSIKINPGLTLLKAGLLTLITLISQPSSAQRIEPKNKTEIVNHLHQKNAEQRTQTNPYQTIRGIVKTKDGEVLGDVNVTLQNTLLSTVTDENGRFELRAEFKPGNVLEFSIPGFEVKEYVISKKIIKPITISLEREDYKIMGEISFEEVPK